MVSERESLFTSSTKACAGSLPRISPIVLPSGFLGPAWRILTAVRARFENAAAPAKMADLLNTPTVLSFLYVISLWKFTVEKQ